ncbi:MAG: hypothetical protein ABL916_00490 [Burkholderiaceae bacterium]
MLIKTRVLDESLDAVFEAHTEISAPNLIEIARSREALALSKGQDWTADAIPVFGKMLIDLTRSGALGSEVDSAAIQVAMAAWLHDSIYCGLDADTFERSDLEFTMLQDGTVRYDRRPAVA